MAIFTPGAGISEISGSIANVTYSRNRGGAYSKTKMTQTNPNSPAQAAARALTASAVAAWKLLSPAVQDAWIQFANTQESKPILSKRTKLSGYTSFIRFHITRNRFGLSGDPLPKIQEPFTNFFDFDFTTDTDDLIVTITGTNLNSDVMAVFYLSDSVSPGRTSIPESKAVIMHFEAAPNGILTVDLSAFWIARFGPLSSAHGNKIFCRIEIVNRLTAQSVVVFRSSKIYPAQQLIVTIASTNEPNNAATSKNGIDWTLQNALAQNGWQRMAYSPSLDIFCIVGSGGTTQRAATSVDGVTWTLQTTPVANAWRGVAWCEGISLFIAVSDTGTGNRVMTSPDGITWTIQVSAANNNWQQVAWSESLGLAVAVGTSGIGNRVMTSPDGIVWTIRTSAADITWRNVIWVEALTLFIAVSASGTGNRVMTSPDGINWTIRVSAVDTAWRGLVWSQQLNLIVATSTSGVGARVMTSPDGINWTAQTAATLNNWGAVTYSPLLNLFIAVASSGVGNRIMTSPDGINWTSRVSPADMTYIDVAVGP